MTQLIEVKVPDIGGFDDIPVIEISVKPGDTVKAEDSLITLESDKATMDVPSPAGGVVKEVRVAIGDKVSEGTLIVLLAGSEEGKASPTPDSAPVPSAVAAAIRSDEKAVLVDEKAVRGEPVEPQPDAAPDGALSFGKLRTNGEENVAPPPYSALLTPDAPPTEMEPTTAPAPVHIPTAAETAADVFGGHKAHASPSVRAFARELGADIGKISGSGPKGRITRDDVVAFIKGVLAAAATPAPASAGSGAGLDLLPWPRVDFARFGPVEIRPLSRIKKISGANLARNWVMIPHVTQFGEADITELEAFRVQINRENEKSPDAPRLTMLAFIIKACVAALKKFPELNASLDGENLVLKQYFHIGFAADTPNGLVVPVIRDADKKGVLQIAAESAALAKKARDGKIGPADMQGGCFSVSSLGGIGGTAFTPIINAPEVAILGVSKTQTKPVWDGKAFVPRQMLPLSLSYDHRVVDGAMGARFTTYLGQLLADLRRASL